MDKTLPVDATADASSKNPWILHILTVNTLNFCSFAMCYDGTPQTTSDDMTIRDNYEHKPIRVAVPNTVDSGGVWFLMLEGPGRSSCTVHRLISISFHQRGGLLSFMPTDTSPRVRYRFCVTGN